MRFFGYILLLAVVCNLFCVNLSALLDERMSIDLVEEKAEDSENELEKEFKFHLSFLLTYQNATDKAIAYQRNAAPANTWLHGEVSTPPPEL